MNILFTSGKFISKIVVIFDIVRQSVSIKLKWLQKEIQEKLKMTYLKQKTSF